MTAYPYKFHLVVPAAACPAVNAWVKAALDPAGADWLTPALSATGSPPATHAQCGFHATAAQAERWAARLKALTPAAGLDGFTAQARDQQAAAVAAYRPVLQAKGLTLSVAFNDQGEQPDAGAVLQSLGLKPVA